MPTLTPSAFLAAVPEVYRVHFVGRFVATHVSRPRAARRGQTLVTLRFSGLRPDLSASLRMLAADHALHAERQTPDGSIVEVYGFAEEGR